MIHSAVPGDVEKEVAVSHARFVCFVTLIFKKKGKKKKDSHYLKIQCNLESDVGAKGDLMLVSDLIQNPVCVCCGGILNVEGPGSLFGLRVPGHLQGQFSACIEVLEPAQLRCLVPGSRM